MYLSLYVVNTQVHPGACASKGNKSYKYKVNGLVGETTDLPIKSVTIFIFHENFCLQYSCNYCTQDICMSLNAPFRSQSPRQLA